MQPLRRLGGGGMDIWGIEGLGGVLCGPPSSPGTLLPFPWGRLCVCCVPPRRRHLEKESEIQVRVWWDVLNLWERTGGQG